MPRGKGKIPARVHLTIRLGADTLDYFKRQPKHTRLIRQVLENYVSNQEQSEGVDTAVSAIDAPTN